MDKISGYDLINHMHTTNPNGLESIEDDKIYHYMFSKAAGLDKDEADALWEKELDKRIRNEKIMDMFIIIMLLTYPIFALISILTIYRWIW
jgi:hypothetical protein